MNKFLVGDTVYDGVNFPGHEGQVVRIFGSPPGKINVKIAGIVATYEEDGSRYKAAAQTLSLAPYTIQLPPQIRTFKEGAHVLVRDNDEEVWIGTIYDYSAPGEIHEHHTKGEDMAWKQCIHFDLTKMGKV